MYAARANGTIEDIMTGNTVEVFEPQETKERFIGLDYLNKYFLRLD